MEEVKGQGNNIRATRDVRRSQSSCSYCLSVVDFLSLNFKFLSVQSFLYVLHSLLRCADQSQLHKAERQDEAQAGGEEEREGNKQNL